MINEYHNEGRIIAFKIGGNATMPVSRKRDMTLPELPEIPASEDQIAQGKKLYNTYCGWCHGLGLVSSMLYPDLRYLSREKHAIFKEIVIDGAFLGSGMPKFDDVMNAEDALAVQAFVFEQSVLLRKGVTP